MPTFRRTQDEIQRFREQVLEAAKDRVPEVVGEIVVRAAAQILQGLTGTRQTNSGAVFRVSGTPVGIPRKWQGNRDRARRGLPPLPKGYVGGRLRANWQLEIGQPSRTTLNDTDAQGDRTFERGNAKLHGDLPLFPQVWITNNLPYARSIEEGPLASGSDFSPGFFFRSVQVTREDLRDALAQNNDLLEGNR